MKRQHQYGLGRRVLITAGLLSLGVIGLLEAQTVGVTELRRQLLPRYDIVALQQGVALVPRGSTPNIRMIQVVDGVVSVDGETLTGRQLSDKLGRDGSLIVQVSYLDRAAQRALAATPSASSSSASASPAGSAAEDTVARSQARYGDVVRFGGSVTVSRNERVEGEVVAIFGRADIDGEVTRDVTVIMGPLTLGPTAVVGGNVTVVGGQFNRAAGATVAGKIDQVSIGNQGNPVRNVIAGPARFRDRFGAFGRSLGGVAGTTTRIALLVFLGLVAVALGRVAIEQIGERAAVSPIRAGLVGLLAEILFVPALTAVVIVLAVSIVGIPLLVLVPFAVAGVILLMFVGFAGAAYHVGVLVTQRLGLGAGPYQSLTVGVMTVAGLTFLARLSGLAGGTFVAAPLVALGYLLEYLAWTIGFGALILTWSDRRRTAISQSSIAPASVAGTA